MPTVTSVNCLQSAVTFAGQLIDFAIQTANHLHRFLDRSSELVRLPLPPPNAVHLSGSAAHLGIDLLAELAVSSSRNCLHDELHTTRLADSVLLGAVLSEVAPLPVTADEPVLVVEAHVSGWKSLDV
ncbi:hypothetical protein IG631_08814 [Alternaria alternata]|jgi:hypothetical protein|nr:hypothetical protein IG631_08814 [Alternaria alternata]